MIGLLPHTPPLPLAATSPVSVIVWSLVILALLVIGMGAALRLRRKIKQEDTNPAPVTGFSLSDLRQMHRAGQLTDGEFERAKEKVVLAAQKAAERAAPTPGLPLDKDSVDAIRARRLARGTREGQTPDDPNAV
jgi:hypothetical protein